MTNPRSEQGFTMIATLLGTAAIALIALVAVTAVNGDLHSTQYDLAHKRAYEAAKAGIDDYAYHLHGNINYWASCSGTAVNQPNVTTNRRKVPGDPGAEYAIELLPATGQSKCEPEHSTTSMIETTGALKGTFRIRSNGFAEKSKVSITTTFRTASFLDYVYFTQLETSDPVTYGFKPNSPELKGAYEQCEKTRQGGRYEANIPSTNQKCSEIVFKTGDNIKGPIHTNDAFAICGSPTLGRDATDPIEVSAKKPGWYSSSGCTGSKENFKGQFLTEQPILTPPPTNASLETLTESAFHFKGQVHICLSGATMVVDTDKECKVTPPLYSGPLPANGLVYVSSIACPSASEYSPYTAQYFTSSECGNAYVHGSYSGQLTIAAANDIIIDGSVCREVCNKESGSGLLGLIANNFVRVFHNYPKEIINENHAAECVSSAGEERLENVVIDAAILAINHSFIVDHYNCGSSLGTLTVHGAISQKFRGAVGLVSGEGFSKNYEYDDRLKYLEPPSFIEPEKLPWLIGRETIG
jgi:type II secretory pathway pseudopilin PulG